MDGLTLASSASSSTGDLPPQEDARLTTYYKLLLPWKSLASSHQSAIPVSISRVNQVDAARLDIEMSAMLKEQLVKVFSLMKPGMLFQYEPELDAFLEFLIWRFSIWVDKPTLFEKDWRDLVLLLLRRYGTVSLLLVGNICWPLFNHFLLFEDGTTLSRYRNLIERALRARLVYGSPIMNRAVSFEYMNRRLVWNEFLELLLLLLPLLNSSSIKNFLLPFSKDKSSDSSVDDTLCPICQGKPTIPFLAIPCQHSYCYYCLQTRCSTAPSFCWPRCGESITALQRHGGSVHNISQIQ